MRFGLLYIGLISALLLFTSGTKVSAVTASDSQLISTLEVGGYEQIKRVAQQIHGEERFSTSVLDTLATVIFQSYEVPDLRVIDSLAWGCRVLGESERYRYLNIVNEMARFAPNAKLREYCNEAAHTISEARTANTNLPERRLMADEIKLKPIWYPGVQYPGQHVSYRIYPEALREKMMEINSERIETINTGGKRQVAQELKQIFGDQGNTPFEVNEAAAGIIWNFVEEKARLSDDTVAWACKAVAVSRSNRYHDLVYEAIQSGSEKSDVVAKYCRLVYDYVGNESETEQFSPGYVFIPELKEQENEENFADFQTIREQLNSLKQQHSEGLIDKQTYDIKREAILADL